MRRWTLIALLALAVICAGIGAGLIAAFTPPHVAGSGWTAYSPLSSTVYSGSYTPIDLTWMIWAPRLGTALLALGAGTTGATAVALSVERRRRSATARQQGARPPAA